MSSSVNWIPSWLSARLANWRAGIFSALVIVIGLTLNLTVLGANPVQLMASPPQDTEQVAAAAETAGLAAALSVDVEIPLDSTDDIVDVIVAGSGAEPALPAALSDESDGPAPLAGTPAARNQPSAAPNSAVVPAPSSGQGPEAIATSPTLPRRIAAPTTAAPTTATPTRVAPSPSPSTTSAPAAAPSTTVAPSTTAVPTTVAPTTAPPTTLPPLEYLTYTVSGGVGDVVLARQGNSISLYGFYPASGWVSEVASNGPQTVKLKFFNVVTEQDREWKATLEGGQLQVEN